MYVDDDQQENIVSPTVASTLLKTEFIEPARNTVSMEATAIKTEASDLGALFREHYQGVFRVAYRITGSHSDAEDALQTIFVRLTPGWTGRDLSPNPRGYLYRAAINASLDIVRRRKLTNSVSLEAVELEHGLRHTGRNPEDNVVDMELRELLRQAVARLEGRAATAFVLRYYEGYDNGRIAEILGTSQLVVAVTLHRARTKLRKEIGNYLEKHHEAK